MVKGSFPTAVFDNEVRIIVYDVDPKENLHPKYNVCIEKGAFTAMPLNKLY